MQESVAVNVLGTLGTVFWCIQLVPQIIRNYRVKDCEGLPPVMLFLWTAAGIPFSIYFVGIDSSIPLRIQPQLFTFFCGVTWLQSLYYPPVSMPVKKIVMYGGVFTLISTALEVGFILWLRPLYRKGITWPMLVFGILASVLIAIGLLPPYFELAKRKGRVIGINFVFLFMDSTGAILSMASVLCGTFDLMGMILYVIVIVLEAGIAISHLIWYIRFGRKEKKELDLTAEANGTEIDNGHELHHVDTDETTDSYEKKSLDSTREREMEVTQTVTQSQTLEV